MEMVEYEYCLSCDGALSKRREYSTTQSGNIVQERRYEYDGLNLLRVDQRVDTDGDGVIEAGETAWRHVEVNSHRPGALGALSPSPPALSHHGERAPVCASGQSTTPSSTTDYAHVYDPVGNAWVILSDMGEEVYWFSQDAFGNELSISPFAGTSWSMARNAGITEHQTGKWIDPFTGLYFFHARWLDAGVGRFVGRDPVPSRTESTYAFTQNAPINHFDPTGKCVICQIVLDELLDHFLSSLGCCPVNPNELMSEAHRIFPDAIDSPGFRKHCYVCCRLTQCGGTRGGRRGYFGNVLWEYLWPSPDSNTDLSACLAGIIYGQDGSEDCRSRCDAVGSILER